MYRKFKGVSIFTGIEMLPAGMVLVTTDDGTIESLIPEKEAGDNIEILDGILVPGFINCHCHLELSHLKGYIPEQTGLVDFVFKVVNERHFAEEIIIHAIKTAENEMYNNGIVAVGDICNNTFAVTLKEKAKLYYHNFIEASGFPPSVAPQRFQRNVDFYNFYSEKLTSNSIVPHAPYSVSPEMFRMIDSFPGNKIITIHNQEIAAENELFEKGTGDLLRMYEKMNIDISFFKPSGKTSLQTYLPYFTKEQKIILVHNVATTEADINFAKLQSQAFNSNIYYCLCPNANLYISNILPDVNLFAAYPDNIVLGTDSLASNSQLSILAELNILHRNYPSLDYANLLQWATLNGAKALGIENTFGSFDKGKKPGVVLINRDVAKRIL
ncbi:MAG: amidohydrolase family protein [Ferruginibacter sp.]